LLPRGNYAAYNWSTGSNQKDVTVDKPGVYVLTVTDAGGCKGSDTIRIVQKNCISGVYIPTAFSPNNNTVNDVFRAKVFGNLTSFQLQVFNRFGQIVFTTADPARGWDGRFGGIPIDAGTFVYQCAYQLEGSKPTVEKGTITLLR
jgi:gliding motility-associated-like protein